MRTFRLNLPSVLLAALSVSSFAIPPLAAFADESTTGAPVPGGAIGGGSATPGDVKIHIETLVSEGPLYEERGLLLKRINAAKAGGTGIQSYMTAFKYIEDLNKSNAAPEKVKERIDGLSKALDDQSKRAQLLKNRPPATPYDGGGTVSVKSPGAGGGNEDLLSQLKGQAPEGLVDKLKAKFGDRIPEGIDSDMIRKKLMEDERGKELLKNLKK
ncbi:MAG: hypothetical protein IAF58_01150 [Leptolyngbya sp.]|nr:hypothetical protein [Candidatus Melainabacteria bacterium]